MDYTLAARRIILRRSATNMKNTLLITLFLLLMSIHGMTFGDDVLSEWLPVPDNFVWPKSPKNAPVFSSKEVEVASLSKEIQDEIATVWLALIPGTDKLDTALPKKIGLAEVDLNHDGRNEIFVEVPFYGGSGGSFYFILALIDKKYRTIGDFQGGVQLLEAKDSWLQLEGISRCGANHYTRYLLTFKDGEYRITRNESHDFNTGKITVRQAETGKSDKIQTPVNKAISQGVNPAISSAPIFAADTETSPSEERWASLEKHMRDRGYVVRKFDPKHGNLITDLKGNPIGETVFAFFPVSMSDEEIKGRIHGVIYHLNLFGKVEMRSITFRSEQLALTHQKNLLDAFASYKWKDCPIQASAVETKNLVLSLHQRTEKGEVVLDILVSNVSTATVEIVSSGIAPPWSVWAWFHWEVDGNPAEYFENVAMIPNAKETRRIPKGESILWATIPVRSLKCLTKNDQEQKEWHRAITDKKRHSITIMPGSQWQKHKLSVVQAIGNAPRENQKDFKVKSGSIDIEQKDTEPTVRGDGKPAPQP